MSNASTTTQASHNEPKLIAIASKIQQKRATLGKGKWLSEELNIAFQELQPLLTRGGLEFKMVSGLRSSVIVHSSKDGRGNTWNDIEAYSIKMMASSLKSPANQILSRTLPEICRTARLELIDTLHVLFDLLNDRTGLEQKIRQQAQQQAMLDQDEVRLQEMKGDLQRKRQQESEQKRKAKEEALTQEQEARLATIAKKREQERLGDQVLEAILQVASVERLFEEEDNTFWELFNEVMGAVHTGIVNVEEATASIIEQIEAKHYTAKK